MVHDGRVYRVAHQSKPSYNIPRYNKTPCCLLVDSIIIIVMVASDMSKWHGKTIGKEFGECGGLASSLCCTTHARRERNAQHMKENCICFKCNERESNVSIIPSASCIIYFNIQGASPKQTLTTTTKVDRTRRWTRLCAVSGHQRGLAMM